ncbi:helix-turn-helix domain-containing protein [Halolamina pelagica]|nr:helix-turn-helix domain-containing protein [Halolamina pelagica]
MSGEGSVVAIDADDADVVALLDDEYARAALVLTYGEALATDEYARAALVLTYGEALATDELADRLDAAPSTMYDRLDRLTDHDLVTEQQRLDPDGHHHKVYRARLDRVVTELTAEGFELRIDRRPTDPADRLTAAFEDLR